MTCFRSHLAEVSTLRHQNFELQTKLRNQQVDNVKLKQVSVWESFDFTQYPGGWFSFPGGQGIWSLSRSFQANQGDLTCTVVPRYNTEVRVHKMYPIINGACYIKAPPPLKPPLKQPKPMCWSAIYEQFTKQYCQPTPVCIKLKWHTLNGIKFTTRVQF